MAGGRTTTRKRTRRKARRRPPTLAERFALPKLPALPHFEQHQLDVIGLAMAAASIFFGLVFYLGWDGGKVGEVLAQGFIFMFGGVAYLVPVALFCWGALLVVRPMLPTVKPFKSGSVCLLTALMLGLAAQTFGLGPNDPPRHGAFAQPAFFEHHGGVVGEVLFWVTRTLFSRAGAHILFVFLLLVGVLLLTGATISGVVAATRKSVLDTLRPPRAEPARPPEVEPVVRATHVEMPETIAAEPIEPVWEPEPEPELEPEPDPKAQGPGPKAEDAAELTPMGNKRSGVTEADGTEYTLPAVSILKRSNGKTKTDPAAEARIGARLVEALSHFDIPSQVVGTVAGPHVTRYELRLQPGI